MLKTKVFIMFTFLKKAITEFPLITGQMVSLKRNQMADTKLLNINEKISEESAKI